MGWPREIHGQNHEVTHTPPRIFECQDPEEKTRRSCWSCLTASFPSPTAKTFQGPIGWIGFKLVGAFKNWGLYVSGSWNLVWMLETSRFFEPSKISKGFFGWARNGLRLSESQRFGEREIKYIAKSAFGQWESLMNEFPGPVLGLQAPSGRFQRQEKAKV